MRISERKPNMLMAVLMMTIMCLFLVAGCGDDDNGDTGTATTDTRESAPAAPAAGGGGIDDSGGVDDGDLDGAGDDDAGGADGAGDDGVDGPDIVSERTEYGPCVDGMQEVTQIIEYSDGTAAGTASMQPCEE